MTDPAPLTVGVLREAAGDRRVALTPDGVRKLQALPVPVPVQVTVETHAGDGAWFSDADYVAAGATVLQAQAVCARADVLVCVRPPGPETRQWLRPEQVLVGLLQPLTDLDLVRSLAEAKVTAISLDGLPRTLSSAQSMDALTSQANVAGYKAALLAADTFGGFFPMLMTAAGTVRPATVLVIGAGVSGLQAIGTARRLGAVVTGYDIRDAARGDIASTGARFLDLGLDVSASGSGGYARELTSAEHSAQQAAMTKALAGFDVVITTAEVPGRRPPVLVSAAGVAAMRPGCVVVDLASGPFGGNVEGSTPDRTIVTDGGVTVIGATDLAASMPRAASTAYSSNMVALLTHLVPDGAMALDVDDAITAGVLVTMRGDIVHPAVLSRLGQDRP